MGGCVSKQQLTPEQRKKAKEEEARSKWVNEMLEDAYSEEREAIKLLFLGAGESGKSTLLKQMVIIHGNGYSDEDRKERVPLIHSNIITAMRVLCKQSVALRDNSHRELDLSILPEHAEAFQLIMECTSNSQFTAPVAEAVTQLWQDPGIQNTFSLRSMYQLFDSAEYFFNRIRTIAQADYVPTTQDILRARIRTTGIVEHKFRIGENDFRMFDVGGQRNARKKWIHCFENVTSVIFVAALSAYDQMLYEDNNTNRMHEALDLFEDICDSRWFQKTAVILFLNKRDIFAHKIQHIPLTTCFPDYTGPNQRAAASRFIESEFVARNRNPGRKIYTHFTNATDTKNIQIVFNFAKVIILRQHLIEIGLMDEHASLEGNSDMEEKQDDYSDGSDSWAVYDDRDEPDVNK
eukprot:TRINITY_DN67553_c14_g4_i1.p1 TRINITY_DN67553_c14_g4~~TRINITY_DN67553_c14_g4_i1.p1  ORF type:complete len:406 (+),score=195.80 TRINITY_DN67553_c14_g4_i1:233-1450(+)